MAATSDLRVKIFSFVDTTLVGQRATPEQLIETALLKKLEKLKGSIEEQCQRGELSETKAWELYTQQEQTIRAAISDQIQTRTRLNSESSPNIILAKIEQRGVKSDGEPKVIENIEESQQYESEDWKPRIELIRNALAHRKFFSFSLVPFSPETRQTWYHKCTRSESEHVIQDGLQLFDIARAIQDGTPSVAPAALQRSDDTESIPYLFDHSAQVSPVAFYARMEGTNPGGEPVTYHMSALTDLDPTNPVTQEGPSEEVASKLKEFAEMFDPFISNPEESVNDSVYFSSTKFSTETSVKPDSSKSPAPVLTGFFAPFTGFSSSLAKPQYDPDHLPSHILSINVFDDAQLLPVLESLEEDTRAQMSVLIEFFRNDPHSKGLGLTVLEPSRKQARTLYFRKPFEV